MHASITIPLFAKPAISVSYDTTLRTTPTKTGGRNKIIVVAMSIISKSEMVETKSVHVVEANMLARESSKEAASTLMLLRAEFLKKPNVSVPRKRRPPPLMNDSCQHRHGKKIIALNTVMSSDKGEKGGGDFFK